MASSSVSQEDIEHDFEKNSRRSRIRTARARQINPAPPAPQQLSHGNVPTTTASVPGSCRLESFHHGHHHSSSSANPSTILTAEDHPKDFDPKEEVTGETKTNASPITNNNNNGKVNAKMHNLHVNKGKQQRDRRKLREKRRSTGVVHLASTESTSGGSTTDDDDESSECGPVPAPSIVTTTASGVAGTTGAGPSSSILSSEITKRNTQHNESLYAMPSSSSSMNSKHHHHHHYRSNSGSSTAHTTNVNSNVSGIFNAMGGASNSGPYPSSIMRNRYKSTSDLEADDENDHDSMTNRSGSSSAFSSSNHLPSLSGGGAGPKLSSADGSKQKRPISSSTPVQRPTTPTGESYSDQIERVIEENKRLLSLMEEKDKKIHLLEFQVQQLMKDSNSRSEEQTRLQRENSTLLRALSSITASKKDSK